MTETTAPKKSRSPKWKLYELLVDETKSGTSNFYYREAKSIFAKWAVPAFSKYAEDHAYTEFKKDETLIGGYFYNPSNGDTLHCVPADMDIESVYPL